MKKRGPKPTTGRFDTREELEEFVWDNWLGTARSQAQIARAAKVSETTVVNIIAKGRNKE